MKAQLETFLTHRSTREKFLLGVALILGIYFAFFHSSFLASIHQIQTLQTQIHKNTSYIQDHQTLNLTQDLQKANKLNQDLHLLITSLNEQSLPWQEVLKQIHQYIRAHQITLWDIDSLDEEKNYQISLSGNASMQDALEFLNFIEQIPLVDLQAFEILESGNFSLQFQSHKILSPTLKYPDITPSQVIEAIRLSQQKNTFNFYTKPLSEPSKESNPQSSLTLQAILNHKAKINGKWIKKGQTIDGLRLEQIKKDSVILRSNTTKLTLTLQNKKFLKISKDGS